jgi:hypothetical protein
MKRILTIFAAGTILLSCHDKDVTVLGYEPVYGDTSEVKKITFTSPQPYENGGKIFVLGNTLYQVENGKGVHVTDITNPSAPKKTAFIKIMGCQEIAVKDDMLITNNMNDMVIVKLGTHTATLVRRLPDSFKNLFNFSYPPEHGKFICPNRDKGVVIGWKKKNIVNPDCAY